MQRWICVFLLSIAGCGERRDCVWLHRNYARVARTIEIGDTIEQVQVKVGVPPTLKEDFIWIWCGAPQLGGAWWTSLVDGNCFFVVFEQGRALTQLTYSVLDSPWQVLEGQGLSPARIESVLGENPLRK